MGLPPLHKVDHTPELIISDDSAWDHARLNKKGELSDTHPWVRYIRGETRGDLGPVRSWLKQDRTPDQDPVVFSFRRMTRPQWILYQDTAAARDDGSTRDARAQELAIRCTLLAADGVKLELNRGSTEDGMLDDGDLERLRELVGDKGFGEVGRMAVACSRTLLADEKKP